MIDQRRDAFQEAYGMWQAGVNLERRLVLPARVDVEQLGIAGRAKGSDARAARLLARRTDHVPQRLLHHALVARARVESRKDEQLHAMSPGGSLARSRTLRKGLPGAPVGRPG